MPLKTSTSPISDPPVSQDRPLAVTNSSATPRRLDIPASRSSIRPMVNPEPCRAMTDSELRCSRNSKERNVI